MTTHRPCAGTAPARGAGPPARTPKVAIRKPVATVLLYAMRVRKGLAVPTIDYNATVYFIPNPDPADTDLDDFIERLMNALAPYHPSVGQEAWHDDIWYAIITFPAEDLCQAIVTALAIVSALGRVHGIDALPTALFDARYHINVEADLGRLT